MPVMSNRIRFLINRAKRYISEAFVVEHTVDSCYFTDDCGYCLSEKEHLVILYSLQSVYSNSLLLTLKTAYLAICCTALVPEMGN